MAEKERLYFAEHRHGNVVAKANGVTFESGVPAEHEVYFAITDSTEFRAPSMTLTHMGGVDIEEFDKNQVAMVPFEALTGLKAFVVANALTDIGAPKEIISPLVQHLPKLWELVHHYGMTTLELNPIRMRPGREGRLTPVACDFKCGFDRDDPRWQRLALPDHLFTADTSDFEHEVNQLRTHQGQSDVFVINPHGTILAPTFGGGANSLVTEVLGEAAIISSDFGGNPPYEKMKEVARICYKHWLKQTNVLFVIGGKSNNTDIYETFRAMGDALREHFSQHGVSPLYVVVGRGGPNLVRGMGALAEPATRSAFPIAFSVRQRHLGSRELRQKYRRVDEAGGGTNRGESRHQAALPESYKRGHGDGTCSRRRRRLLRTILGMNSLSEVATRDGPGLRLEYPWKRVRLSHSGRATLFRRECRVWDVAGRRGQVLATKVGDIPVYNNVRERYSMTA